MKQPPSLHDALSERLSSGFIESITRRILLHPEEFAELYALLFLKDEHNVSWRAAWACDRLCRQHPEWLTPKREELMQYAMTTQHSGTKRLLLSIVYQLPVSQPLSVPFFDFCLETMLSPDEAVAVQSLCIKLCYKMCLTEPELLPELRLYLENAMQEAYSPGVRNCIKNTLKNIQKFHRQNGE